MPYRVPLGRRWLMLMQARQQGSRQAITPIATEGDWP